MGGAFTEEQAMNRTVARNFAPLADKSCSSSLNGSYIEQISHNRVRRLTLEVQRYGIESLI